MWCVLLSLAGHVPSCCRPPQLKAELELKYGVSGAGVDVMIGEEQQVFSHLSISSQREVIAQVSDESLGRTDSPASQPDSQTTRYWPLVTCH